MTDSTWVLPALEARLIDAEVRRSLADLEELLAPEFREVGTSGRITSREEVFATLRFPGGVDIAIEDLVVQPVTDETAVVTYRATARHSETGKVSLSVRSSVWRRRTGRWQVVFHQGTRLP